MYIYIYIGCWEDDAGGFFGWPGMEVVFVRLFSILPPLCVWV
jgi:hypothetical protein